MRVGPAANGVTCCGPGSCSLPSRAGSNTAIARRLGITVDTVRKWRARFAAERMPGLEDRPRSGRPRVFTDGRGGRGESDGLRIAGRDRGAAGPLVGIELAAEAVARGVVDSVSASTVRRWLTAMRSSHGSTGHGYSPAIRTSRPRPPECWTCMTGSGRAAPLGADEFVISADEKSQLQALRRRHPDLPPGARAYPPAGVRVSPRRHPGLPGRLRRSPRHR